MQTLITGLVVIFGLVLASFGLGRSRGKNAAEIKAEAARVSEQAEESEKHIEVLKNAVDVQQDVNKQPDSAVAERLRQKWLREGD